MIWTPRQSVTRNLSHDFSQPIRSGSEKAQRLRDAPILEGPHSVGVWTLKIYDNMIYLGMYRKYKCIQNWIVDV